MSGRTPIEAGFESQASRGLLVYTLSPFLSPYSSVPIPLSPFLCPHSSVPIPLSSFLCPHSSVLIPLSSFLCPHSSVLIPLSSFLCPPFLCPSFLCPYSSVPIPLSSFLCPYPTSNQQRATVLRPLPSWLCPAERQLTATKSPKPTEMRPFAPWSHGPRGFTRGTESLAARPPPTSKKKDLCPLVTPPPVGLPRRSESLGS